MDNTTNLAAPATLAFHAGTDAPHDDNGAARLEQLRDEVAAAEFAAAHGQQPGQAAAALEAGTPAAVQGDAADEDDEDGEPEEEQPPPGCTAVKLGEHGTIRILPPEQWTSSAQGALRSGDFDGWAEQSVFAPDFEDVWCEANDGRGPYLGTINDMFDVWAKATGQRPGKSRTPGRFSRPSRMR